MAGYNWQSGKSNNAVAAENEGIFPATQFSKLVSEYHDDFKGCTARDVKILLSDYCGEWHHTSKFYNKTYYYDFNEFKTDPDMQEELREGIRMRKEYQRLLRKLKRIDKNCWLHVRRSSGDLDEWYRADPKDEWYCAIYLERIKSEVENGYAYSEPQKA